MEIPLLTHDVHKTESRDEANAVVVICDRFNVVHYSTANATMPPGIHMGWTLALLERPSREYAVSGWKCEVERLPIATGANGELYNSISDSRHLFRQFAYPVMR